MEFFVILLCGINVGGRNLLPMSALSQALRKAGIQNVQTYLQSGNIVIESTLSVRNLQLLVQKILQKTFDLDVAVQVLTADFWAELIQVNPFTGYQKVESYHQKLSITFLAEPLTTQQIQKITDLKTTNEDFALIKNAFYGWYGDGFGRSKLAAYVSKISYGTTRNWKTVQTLATLIELKKTKP